MSTVLVTGGSGFIHLLHTAICWRQLIRVPLCRGPWERRRLAGSDFRLRLRPARRISFPGGIPRHEDELMVPARDGALCVLRASRDAGVKRVVPTSSSAAVGYSHIAPEHPLQRDQLDRAHWQPDGLRQIQDAGRTRRMGFYGSRRREPRTLRY
jgi:hypothetical protein